MPDTMEEPALGTAPCGAWDVDSGASQVLRGHTYWGEALAVLPDGRVVSGSHDEAVIFGICRPPIR